MNCQHSTNTICFSEMHLIWIRQEIQTICCFPCMVVSTADLSRKISGFFCNQDCRILDCRFPWLNVMFQFDLQQNESNLTLKCLVINPFWVCIAAHSNFTCSHYPYTCLLGELASANVKSHYDSWQILLAFSSFLWNPLHFQASQGAQYNETFLLFHSVIMYHVQRKKDFLHLHLFDSLNGLSPISFCSLP